MKFHFPLNIFFIPLFILSPLHSEEPDQKKTGLFESSEHIDPSKENLEEKNNKNESPHKITGGVTYISDYRSRGLSQTMCRPAVQGEITYTHKSGIYIKNWASNVDGAYSFLNDSCLEWDVYLGFTHSLFESSIQYDIGLEYYYYPGARAPVPHQNLYDSLEYYVALSYKGFNIRIAQTLTDFYGVNSFNPPTNWKKKHVIRPNGHSYLSPYIEMNYSWKPIKNLTATLHVGYQGVTNYSQLNYFDWLVGLAYQLDWFDLNIMYVDTTANRSFYTIPDSTYKPKFKYIGRGSLIFGISKGF